MAILYSIFFFQAQDTEGPRWMNEWKLYQRAKINLAEGKTLY